MKKSIKHQMMLLFVGLVVLALVLLAFMNSTFLEQYYISNKENDLIRVYEGFEKVIERNELTGEAIEKEIGRTIEKGNISVIVCDPSWGVIVTTETTNLGKELMERQLVQNILNQNNEAVVLKKKKIIRSIR